MTKPVKMAACILICALGMGCIQPSCPFLRLSAPERTDSPDGRVCYVMTGQVDGRLSHAAMRAWLRQAFAAYEAPMTVEWQSDRLQIASGFSPLIDETLRALHQSSGICPLRRRAGCDPDRAGVPRAADGGW
jgi:hypothetical protein